MQPRQGAAIGLIYGIIFLKFISMVEHNECEDKGQYRAANGRCCHLCPPGSSWLYHCFYNGEQSLCTSCMPGKDYMDVANRDLQCKKCSTCNRLYEDFQQDCTLTSDTLCQSKDGYSRSDPSQSCEVISNTEKNIAISAGIGIILLVVVALLIYRKKKCLYPFDESGKVTETVPLLRVEVLKAVLQMGPQSTCNVEPTLTCGWTVGAMFHAYCKFSYKLHSVTLLMMQCTSPSFYITSHPTANMGPEEPRMFIEKRMRSSNAEVWRQFHELLPEVYKSISENTFYFLYEMDKKYNIPISMYWRVYEITDISARAIFILNFFIGEGEEMCRGLLEMILAGQNKQMQLQTLLDSAVKCSPTLNPNTAHEDLNISNDGKTAKWLKRRQQKPDHPDRFEYWSQVLSSESFSEGCHLWVVNVGDVENLRVGVSYGSILRKEPDSACLMGCNSRSWCLWKHENKYKAWHDQHCTELEMGEHPRRIGVGLDYHKWVLIFYNADTNEHLHTFYAHFSEPLHVGLWVWSGVLTIEPVNND